MSRCGSGLDGASVGGGVGGVDAVEAGVITIGFGVADQTVKKFESLTVAYNDRQATCRGLLCNGKGES